VAGEETDKSSCKAVALYADVEVVEREAALAVVEDALQKIAEVDVVVVGLCHVNGAAGTQGVPW
jgi:hypothetical protein